MNICSIASARSLARARVMASSLRRHNPDVSLTVLLVDGDPQSVPPIDGARLLGIDEVAGAAGGLIAAANAPAALAPALLPFLLRAAQAEGVERLLYIGAGQRVLGPLDELFALLARHELVLVAAASARDTLHGAIADDPARGAFSRELMGFGDGSAAKALLDAWPRYFAIAADNGAGAVRRWIDALPLFAEDVGMLRDPDYAVDAATLAARVRADPAERDAMAHSARGGESAPRAIDFGSLDADDPIAWLAGREAIDLSLRSELRELIERQAQDLRDAGWEADRAHPEPYVMLDDGLRLTDTIRTLIATAILDGEVTLSPFSAAGRAALYEYLNGEGDRGSEAGLTRLHVAIWRARADLHASYPHIDGPDGSGLAGWLCLHGIEQEGLVAELLPATPELAYRDADPHIHEGDPPWGVNVVGFFTAELGVGEAARLLIAGLDARDVPAAPIQGHLMPPSRRGVEFAHMAPEDAPFAINILAINGDGVPVFAREVGRSFFERRYTIALWWWEAGEPPASWKPAYEFVDEVWVASQHVYDAIAPSSPVPVVRVRLPVPAPALAGRSRGELHLPEEGFLFLCMHDYHSVAARKNPLGVVEAFRRAFEPGSGAKLLVKSLNSATHPIDHARVIAAAGDHEDIVLLDSYLTPAEKNDLLGACDCFVSLHRSEGFGIPLAEAMALGKPVIATRYGGSLEFMTEENSYLVDWEPVPVGDGAYPYAPDVEWAEPDIDDAAAQMRRVFEDRAGAHARGRLARRHMLERHAPAAAGESLERRLELLHSQLGERGLRSLELGLLPPLSRAEEMTELIDTPPALSVGRGRLGPMKSRAYRPVSAWSRSYAEHQRRLEEATQLNIERIDERLREVARTLQGQQAARHAETLALLRRLEAELEELRGRSS